MVTRRNSTDEELRELERRAAGDPAAEWQLGFARNRLGLCGKCGARRELKARLSTDSPFLCSVCAAEAELEALEKSTSTYTGYLDQFGTFVTTFAGFPLARTLWAPERVDMLRSARGRGTVSSQWTWRAIDRWGRQWYGRNAGLGMVTGMRLRKLTTHEQRAYMHTRHGGHLKGVVKPALITGAEYDRWIFRGGWDLDQVNVAALISEQAGWLAKERAKP